MINGTNGASIEYVSGGAIVRDGSGMTFQGRTWDVPSARTVRATDTGGKLLLGGAELSGVSAARTMTPLAIKTASAAALKALPVVSTGVALWDIWDAIRVGPDGSGGLVSDPGVSQVTEVASQWRKASGNPDYTNGPWRGNPAAACEDWAQTLRAVPSGNMCGVAYSSVTVTSCPGPKSAFAVGMRVVHTQVLNGTCNTNAGTTDLTRSISYQSANLTQCPASIDPLDPAQSIPAGAPLGPDGKCRQARYQWQRITAEAAAAKFEAGAPAPDATLKQLAEDAVQRGQGIEASERQLSGPASATGTPTTTTTTQGTSTTTTTKTPAYSYTYTANTITYNTTITTVVNTDGTTTSTTTENAPPEDSEQCKKTPDAAGCAKLGEPTDGTVPKESKPITYAPVSMASGSCPAAVPFTAFGVTRNLVFTPLCDAAATWVRGVVLVLGVALAGFVFVGGLKS